MEGNKVRSAATILAASAASLMAADAGAEAAPEKAFVGTRISRYAEDELSTTRVLPGAETERYTIDVQHLNFMTPIAGRFSLSADIIRESMTGASPIGAVKLAEGDVRAAMSGASITEERQDVTFGGAWYGDSGVLKVGAGRSTENDYDARYFSLGYDFTFNEKNSTLGIGISTSDDELTPTDAEVFNRIPYAEKESRSVYLGYTQVVTKNFLVQTSVGLNQLEGYLSDPYKAGSRDNPLDRRPGERTQRTWTLGARYFIEPVETALKADYRYFTDDWGIDSHTVQFGLGRQFGEAWLLEAGFRLYMQGEADFYEPYQVPEAPIQPEHFSMDYRLSPYGAASFNVNGRWAFSEDWTFVFVVERYQSGAEYTLADVKVENPAVVDFTRASLGLEFRF